MSNRGLLFILSAPAGTGKTTLVKELVKRDPQLCQSISYTTRRKREGEIEGQHYHFLTEEEFLKKRNSGDFLEEVELFGHRYGTSKSDLFEGLSKGFHMILVIDTEGAKKIRAQVAAVSIFLLPPSLEILRERLLKRNSENERRLEQRLRIAKNELNERNLYDYQVVNDRLEDALLVLHSIVIAEAHRTAHIKF